MKMLAMAAMAAVCFLVSGVTAQARTEGSCVVHVYASGSWYTGSVTRSVRTSCPFARNVTRASLRFIIRHGGSGDGIFRVRAYSPVTLRWYQVSCRADGELYRTDGIRVTCIAGVGARVRYHAWSNG